MKKLLSFLFIAIIAAATLSAAIIIPDTANTSFTLMSDNSYDKDYVVDKTTWTVRRNGYQIDQMGDNIWTLADKDGTTIVAVNATESELSDVIYLYYRNKPVNLVAYNTPISLSTIRSLSQLRSAYISDMDSSVALYLGSQKNGISFKSISKDTSLSLVNGKVSVGKTSSSSGNYILVTCPECGSQIYVNISAYI